MEDFFKNSVMISETKEPQELRLKSANQGERAGLYHYASEDVYGYNPFVTAGVGTNDRLVTSSKVCAEKGVLVNYTSTAYTDDAVPLSEHMMADITKSNILSGKVLSVSQTTIKVQFDVDDNQSEGEAKELPYENTLSNSFYCMPEVDDHVFGYIDNRGVAVILGCKRKAVTDDIFDRPEEKSITALNNLVHFATNRLSFIANREEADKDETKRIAILLDKEDGIDIHASGSISVYSDGKIGLQAGDKKTDIEGILEDTHELEKNGIDQYEKAKGATLQKKSWIGEFGEQFLNSFEDFFKTITFEEARKDFVNKYANEEKESVHESFETGTFYMGAEQICLIVGDSYIVLGNPDAENVSMIYINTALFHWLGFKRENKYETVEDKYTDNWDFALDVAGLLLDITAAVVFCFCPVVGFALMGASVLLSLTRGDYCGGLLGCLPMVSEVGKCEKILAKIPKIKDGIKSVAKVCDTIDKYKGYLVLGSQGYSYGMKMHDKEMERTDWTQLGLIVASFLIGKGTGDYREQNKITLDDMWGIFNPKSSNNVSGGTSTPSVDGPTSNVDAPTPNVDGPTPNVDGPTPNVDAPTPNVDTPTPDIDANTTSTMTAGADPVDMVTGALTEQHTDFLMKDIKGDYAVVRTYRSNRENKGRMLGSRWIFNFEVSLHRANDNLSVYLPDAHKEQFRLTESGWKNLIPGKEKYRLTELTDGYELEELDTSKLYRFDKSGHIICIYDEYRNATRYTYMGNQIAKITLASAM